MYAALSFDSMAESHSRVLRRFDLGPCPRPPDSGLVSWTLACATQLTTSDLAALGYASPPMYYILIPSGPNIFSAHPCSRTLSLWMSTSVFGRYGSASCSFIDGSQRTPSLALTYFPSTAFRPRALHRSFYLPVRCLPSRNTSSGKSLMVLTDAANAEVVSLFIPATGGPAAWSAELLGTDLAGHTTWKLSPRPESGGLPPATQTGRFQPSRSAHTAS